MMADPRELSGAHEAIAHALCNGPDGQDWADAQERSFEALEVIEENGYVVISRTLLDELERHSCKSLAAGTA